jgi:hypothetical protein
MNASVIEHILTSDDYTSQWYQGFSTPDLNIPRPSKEDSGKPHLYVLNTDTSDGPGEHWCVAVLFLNRDICEFFDPLGMPPNYYGFEKPILRHCSKIKFNEYRVQSISSSTCGHHCLFFALNRARKISPEKILSKYSHFNFIQNDHMVYDFVVSNYGHVFAKIT